MENSGSGGSVVKKEDDHDHDREEIMNRDEDHKGSPRSKMEISTQEFTSSLTPSTQKGQDDLLKSTKAEMGEVMEENQKLKIYLDRIMKDYRALQTQFHEMVQQEPNKSSSTITTSNTHQENEEPEFVSLSLGRSSSSDHGKKVDKINNVGPKYGKDKIEDDEDREGLALGLDCKFDQLPKQSGKSQSHDEHSPNPSLETNSGEAKEEAGETWPPQKGLKTARNGGEEEVSLDQNPTKRARVSVRVRCDTPNMNDGCQWRKYGQKIAKGNPCPRAYYRCTVAPNCPVRKQVQRCAEDMSILITTYEGTHSHPLPISATAMASTTSAAASMLLSGSTSSSSTGAPSATSFPSTTTTTGTLNGLNFYLSDNSRPKPFYLPNSSLSSTPSFPTITLDLTTNPSAASHLNRLSSPNTFPPRYSSTNLNFSSLQESNSLPLSWSTTNYANPSTTQPFNRSSFLNNNSLNFGSRQSQETIYQNYIQKHMQQQNNLSSDPIAAATKAITSDPSFQSALAAALTSIMGSGNVAGSQTSPEKMAPMNMKVMDHQASFPVLSSFQSTSAATNVNRCAPSFLSSKASPPSSANNSGQPSGSLMFLSTPNGNNATSPSHENRDHIS